MLRRFSVSRAIWLRGFLLPSTLGVRSHSPCGEKTPVFGLIPARCYWTRQCGSNYDSHPAQLTIFFISHQPTISVPSPIQNPVFSTELSASVSSTLWVVLSDLEPQADTSARSLVPVPRSILHPASTCSHHYDDQTDPPTSTTGTDTN
jgi:hypothetical protein